MIMTRIILTLGIIGLVFSSAHIARAVEWELPLNPVCCSAGYTVYGDEQPVEKDGTCVVEVDSILLTEGGANIQYTPKDSRYDWSFGLYRLFSFVVPKEFEESVNYIGLQIQKARYHVFLNEEFRKALERVMAVKNEAEWKALFPSSARCDENNLNTNCMAERLMCSYEKYQGVMFEMLRDTDVSHLTRGNLQLGQVLPVDMSFKQSVLEEASVVSKAFDTSIALYHEVLKSYRLHLQYKDLVSSLVKVRNWTGYVKNLFGCFPGKLVGTASTKCQ